MNATENQQSPTATVPVQRDDAASHDQHLAASIGKNTVFGVVSKIAQMGTRLVTVPIVIAHLGLAGYGIWSVIMTAAAYMRFGSIGIKSAFQKYVADATGNGDYEKANRLLSTGFAAMAVLSVAGLIPIAIFSRKLAVLAGVPPEFLSEAAGSITLLALIMVMSNVGAVFEAIVMGGHRIDIARKYTTFFTIAEMCALIVLLHYGFGLLAMSIVMGVSELGFVVCCYFASLRVVPQIRIRVKYMTWSACPELLRYAGSYQLVNILEVMYGATLPIAILRVFGPEAAGIYALAFRLQSSAQMLPDAFLLPILSGGAKVFSSGSSRDMQLLLSKSFKVTLGLTLFPLAFIAVFGTTVLYAWTGESNSYFQIALYWICVTGFFNAFSLLALVLYRVSGRALLDNIRQLLRIVMIFTIAAMARRLGFYGVLAGLATSELVGLIFMMFALRKTFPQFEFKALAPVLAKLSIAIGLIVLGGWAAGWIPLPIEEGTRIAASIRLAIICIACVAVAWPALVITKSLTVGESKAILDVFLPGRLRPAGAGVTKMDQGS